MGFWVNTAYFSAMVPLTNAQIRVFKAQAQRLKATLKVGKEGLSQQFLAALDDALNPKSEIKMGKMSQDVGAEMNRKNRSHTQSGLVRFLRFIYAQQIAADCPF